MPRTITIGFEKVTKRFYLQEDRTFKEVIPNLLRGRAWAHQMTVFKDLTFHVFSGETVGIVGRNGAGKSTIMKLIAGVTYPSQGKVEVVGTVAPLIELGAGFHHELSGLENIYLNAAILGMHKRETEEIVDQVIEFSGLADFIHVPLKRYSTGMQMRLAFSVAIHTKAPILLIDEVLAVGDVEFQRKCLKKLNELKASGERTTIFVSHDREAVKNFCDRVIVLDQGKILFDGDPDSAIKKYHQLVSFEETL